ncbi:UNVERIFIED_CONTAM: hypothetical protein RF653_11695 [Kocuria sp. CPCC 205316]|uniref:hypothetical protein n=1 Tax=Kocuria TaxID=57493 RepID=UPI0036DBF74A
MTRSEDWPQRAWWSDVLSVFVIVVVGLIYGWGVAVLVGVVVVPSGLWWELGPFWTREQRARIHRRAQHRSRGRQG